TPSDCTLSLHDALPISGQKPRPVGAARAAGIELGVDVVVAGVIEVRPSGVAVRYRLVDVDTGRVLLADHVEGGVADLLRLQESRSEEHTSELQSPCNLV